MIERMKNQAEGNSQEVKIKIGEKKHKTKTESPYAQRSDLTNVKFWSHLLQNIFFFREIHIYGYDLVSFTTPLLSP